MERVEGSRRWDTCQDALPPADELKAACDAAGGWLKASPASVAVPTADMLHSATGVSISSNTGWLQYVYT